jgi:hypothetical protein
VQKYESGQNRIGSGRLLRIAVLLEVPPAVLFGGRTKQHHVASPVDDLAVEGAERLLRAFDRITDRDARSALLDIAIHLARK